MAPPPIAAKAVKTTLEERFERFEFAGISITYSPSTRLLMMV
ncbi:hypothetical protein [Erythrobacter insulae]|nr:hypothetical protein [Erythrobacter insulae]